MSVIHRRNVATAAAAAAAAASLEAIVASFDLWIRTM